MKSIFQATVLQAVLLLPTVVTAQSIAEVASGVDSLSTLVDLVSTAGLLGAIDGTSGTDVTVFAPTNDAIAALPDALVEDLVSPPWSAHLSHLIQSHIVGSVVPSSALTAPQNVTMVSGEVFAIAVDPVITVDGVEVTQADVAADNGVVHVIDGVLTPAWLDQTLPEAAAGVPSVSTLVALLGQADLVDALSGDGPFTVFAPTDDAFAALGESLTECVTSNTDILSATLTYHVLNGVVPAASVATGSVETLEGSEIAIDATLLKINEVAGIITPDALLANNGIVHVIDSVLVPPSVADAVDTCVQAKLTIPERAAELDDFSTLVDLLGMADLVTTLDGEGPFTVFAPTDAAFAALSEDVTACVTGDADVLSSVLLYHVLAANVPAADVTTGMVATVEGSMLDLDAMALTINNSTSITTPDAIIASNGVVHVIDAVLVPPTVSDKLNACLAAEEVVVTPPPIDEEESESEDDMDSSSPRSCVAALSAALIFVSALF